VILSLDLVFYGQLLQWSAVTRYSLSIGLCFYYGLTAFRVTRSNFFICIKFQRFVLISVSVWHMCHNLTWAKIYMRPMSTISISQIFGSVMDMK